MKNKLINKIFVAFAVIFMLFSFVRITNAQTYKCQYLVCSSVSCTKDRCLSSGATCKAGQYGGNKGLGVGSLCCLNQCCNSGYYDCCSSIYGCCCPIYTPPPVCTNTCACPSGYSYTKPSGDYITKSETGKKTDCTNCNKTCYQACPLPTCSSYSDESGISWDDSCSSGDCREASLNVPIPTAPSGCPTSKEKTCYSDNDKPIVSSLEIVPADNITPTQASSNILMKFVSKLKATEFSDDEFMGFYSTDHSGIGLDYESGGGVNNPVGIVATYTDADGRADIEALYVWWNPSSTKNFNTPDQITTNDQESESTSNWGFMISRNSSDEWSDVYIPGSSNTWVYEGSIGSNINILGPTGKEMITLSDISVDDSVNNGVQLQLKMNFLSGADKDVVQTSKYNLWAMANDYIGFTNLLEDGNIMDDDWYNDSDWQDWTLDMQRPEIVFASPADTDKSEITIDLQITDNDNLSHIRLDACKLGIDDPVPISSDLGGEYILENCDTFSAEGIDITGTSLLGSSSHDLSVDEYTSSVEIALGIDTEFNKEGSITFYLTAMDDAGNVKLEQKIYKLEQWAAVKDGLVFGRNGVTSSSRELGGTEWDSHSLLSSFDENNTDLTNQVLLGAKSLSTIFLRELVHADVNNSFTAANYPGLFLGLPYQELRVAYKNRFLDSEITNISGTLSGNLSDECPSGYCILESSTDLNIENFVCDGTALITATGDVNITPDLTNGSDEDACIILAQNNINIEAVGSDEVNIVYDTVRAFLIAGGQIHILSDGNESDHGLYVEGGLVSFTPIDSQSSVFNEREIFYSHMGVYPVLVVDNSSKYGLVGKAIFGSQIDVFKTEVGFKPF